MSRLNEANILLAKEIIGRYPKARSATIPLLHLSQQQNGHITNDAIAHIAELVGATAAEVDGPPGATLALPAREKPAPDVAASAPAWRCSAT